MKPDVPTFEIEVDAAGRPRFAHPRQGYAWLKQYAGQLIAGQFYPFGEHRSDRQNRAGHVLLTIWAKERGWAVDTLKQFVLGRAFGWLEFADIQTGEVIKVLAEPHTSKLSMAKFCTFIESILDLAAEDGVFLQAPDEYRRAKEKAAKQMAREARKAAKAA